MSKIITGVVIDGFHAGHVVRMEYSPILRLLKPNVMRVDYCCPQFGEWPESRDEIIEYKECFRSVDRRMVLYSEKGESMDLLGKFPQTYADKPWHARTMLYLGYHNEPVQAKELTDEEHADFTRDL
jgi:hypothetical protein